MITDKMSDTDSIDEVITESTSETSNVGHTDRCIDIFIGVSLFAIAIYTIYAFIQRKPNALFYGRLYVFLVLCAKYDCLLI